MRTTKTVTVKRVEQIGIVCDLCGAKSADAMSWQHGERRFSSTSIAAREQFFPGDGTGFAEQFMVDLCPACFASRLIPWLKSQGVKGEWKRT
ncbi:hypothetical protein IMZ48_25600 [Candidatus Bathyarchaeota archaeon]|nr:hypothetical protein [Chloroflexota bacterium]MBE3045857.1 hypothetical protein [Candidatus Bathyarchaeota archaeon]MBE3117511.1 hypothetical protein [Candidatus Atribacteria bacterium]